MRNNILLLLICRQYENIRMSLILMIGGCASILVHGNRVDNMLVRRASDYFETFHGVMEVYDLVFTTLFGNSISYALSETRRHELYGHIILLGGGFSGGTREGFQDALRIYITGPGKLGWFNKHLDGIRRDAVLPYIQNLAQGRDSIDRSYDVPALTGNKLSVQ